MITAPAVRRLQSHSVHVWRIPLEVSAERFVRFPPLLSDDERARAGRFRFVEDRRRYIVGRGCLRMLLASYLHETAADSLKITYGPAGKPHLDGTGLGFNLSHSGEWALLAISREVVGIDLEQSRSVDYDGISREIFSASELALLAKAVTAEKVDTFFRLWVRREARLKALGVGITERQCPQIPVYDLAALPGFCAALATVLPNPMIELLDYSFTSQPHPGT